MTLDLRTDIYILYGSAMNANRMKLQLTVTCGLMRKSYMQTGESITFIWTIHWTGS